MQQRTLKRKSLPTQSKTPIRIWTTYNLALLRKTQELELRNRLGRALERKEQDLVEQRIAQRIAEEKKSGRNTKRIQNTLIVHNSNGRPTQALKYENRVNARERFALKQLAKTPLALKHSFDAKKGELAKEFIRGKIPEKLTPREIRTSVPALLATMHRKQYRKARFGLFADREKTRKVGTFREAMRDFIMEVSARKTNPQLTEKQNKFIDSVLRTVWVNTQENPHLDRTDFRMILNDYSKNNMIRQRNGEIKFIDYGDLEINDPAKDLGGLFAKMRLTPKQQQTFVQSYSTLTGDKTIANRVPLWLVVEEVRRLKKRKDLGQKGIQKKLARIAQSLAQIK